MTADTPQARLLAIRDQITQACARCHRDPGAVTLVAVSKGHDADAIRVLYDLGVRDFAESYVQEWRAKAELLQALPELRWHFIGGLQRNKARFLAEQPLACVHSIDSARLAETLARRLPPDRSPLEVMVEVQLADEPGKAGTDADLGVRETLAAIDALPQLRAIGLMCIPPPVDDPQDARPFFAALRALRDSLNTARAQPLTALSMGMSHDFEVAIEEGATHVRVGTALFGERPPRQTPSGDAP